MIVYKEYNRARAVAYAKKWALSRNPLFVNFAGRGGDCTSFVSQCLYAGTCQMNFTPDFGWYYIDQNNRVYQDDACATYAWLIAEMLNMRPIIMGYGAVGVTRAGMGLVPPADIAYPQNFDGSPITHAGQPSVIVINHGANDRGNGLVKYLEKYAVLLDVVRQMNPNATVVALSAFCGAFHAELGEMIAAYNEKNGCQVHFVDTNGWIPVEPLHPLRDGHRTVAENFVAAMKDILKK